MLQVKEELRYHFLEKSRGTHMWRKAEIKCIKFEMPIRSLTGEAQSVAGYMYLDLRQIQNLVILENGL